MNPFKDLFTRTETYKDGYGRERETTSIRKGRIIAMTTFFVLVIVLGVGAFCVIPTGSTGIRVTCGQVDPNTLEAGFHAKIPFVQRIVTINNKQQEVNFDSDKVYAESSERTAVYFEQITVTYTIDPSESSWIYSNISDYKHNLINLSIVSSAVKTTAKKFNSTDVTNRGIIEPATMAELQKALNDKYGREVVHINKVALNNIDFDEAYNKAILDKQNAQLAYEKQQIANKQAVEKAEADAQSKKKAAEAEAEAIKIKANAEAEANKKLNDSLSDKVLAKEYYDKWDGKLPTYYGSNSGLILSPDK